MLLFNISALEKHPEFRLLLAVLLIKEIPGSGWDGQESLGQGMLPGLGAQRTRKRLFWRAFPHSFLSCPSVPSSSHWSPQSLLPPVPILDHVLATNSSNQDVQLTYPANSNGLKRSHIFFFNHKRILKGSKNNSQDPKVKRSLFLNILDKECLEIRWHKAVMTGLTQSMRGL